MGGYRQWFRTPAKWRAQVVVGVDGGILGRRTGGGGGVEVSGYIALRRGVHT